MTTRTGVLLRSGNIKDYTPLGEEGNPVYKWATQIRVTIRRKISSESINVFAIPQPNENGDIIDWYAPELGSVIPWSSATREEKISAKEQLSSIQQKLNDIEEFNQSNNSDQSIFKRLLGHVIQFPNDEHVYLVNGKPVLTFWGFVGSEANVRPDPLAILTIPELPRAEESIPAHAVHDRIVDIVPVKRRFSWWWLLALLPLLLLLFFLLRGCGQDLKAPVLDNRDIDPVDVQTLDIEINRISEGAGISSINGINSPQSSLAGEANEDPLSQEPQDGELQQEEPEEIELVEPEAEPEPEEPEAQEPSSEEPLPEEPENDQEMPEPDDTQPPNENPPLEIPQKSDQQKPLDFLNGRWQADSGLMDKQGRPVKLEYDFKDGKGNVRIKRNDGTVCSGTVEANMKNSELTFSDNEVIKCPSGQSYRPAKVKCKADSNNKTVCEGSYSGGENFKMDINKSENAE